jgi:hypothetical protein
MLVTDLSDTRFRPTHSQAAQVIKPARLFYKKLKEKLDVNAHFAHPKVAWASWLGEYKVLKDIVLCNRLAYAL